MMFTQTRSREQTRPASRGCIPQIFEETKAAITAERAMEDTITFALPNHTEETPALHFESLREAISEAYHINWTRYSAAKNKNQKDKDAGKKLSRSNMH